MARFALAIVVDADDEQKAWEEAAQALNALDDRIRYVGTPIEVPEVDAYYTASLKIGVP